MNALIVLGGDAPGEALLKSCVLQADMTIAADRGLEAFAAAGLKPDLLLGDMDSVSGDVLARMQADTEIDCLPCIKDDTDGVHALDVALARGADRITILGALGGRMDHAMANLMLLVRAHRHGAAAEILDEHVRIARVCGEAVLSGAKGDTVSLLPAGDVTGVTLEGFYYHSSELLSFDFSYPLGVSNVVTEDFARVTSQQGDLLLFHYYAGL
ncbi:MAG: thiamine diphosphokinase [Clostridia bacterium]|nr:thiamine diphosphokinase [Clostridia bacterium]